MKTKLYCCYRYQEFIDRLGKVEGMLAKLANKELSVMAAQASVYLHGSGAVKFTQNTFESVGNFTKEIAVLRFQIINLVSN